MNTTLQTKSPLNQIDINLFTGEEINSSLFNDLVRQLKHGLPYNFIESFKKQVAVVKEKIHLEKGINYQLIQSQLRVINSILNETVISYELLFFNNPKILKTAQKRILKDLNQIIQDLTIIQMYIEV